MSITRDRTPLEQCADTLQFCMEQLELARTSISNERRTDMWTIGGNVHDAANALYFAIRDLAALGIHPAHAPAKDDLSRADDGDTE